MRSLREFVKTDAPVSSQMERTAQLRAASDGPLRLKTGAAGLPAGTADFLHARSYRTQSSVERALQRPLHSDDASESVQPSHAKAGPIARPAPARGAACTQTLRSSTAHRACLIDCALSCIACFIQRGGRGDAGPPGTLHQGKHATPPGGHEPLGMASTTASLSTPLPALVGVQPPMRASSPSNHSPAPYGLSSVLATRRVPHGLSSVLAAARPHAPRTLAAEHARRLLMSSHRLDPSPNPSPHQQPASMSPPRRTRSPEPVADKAPYAIQHHAPRSAPQANPAALAAATTTTAAAAAVPAPAPAARARAADGIRDSLDSVLWTPPSAALRQTSSLHDDAALFRGHSGELGNHSAAGGRCASAPPGVVDRAYALDGFGSDDDAPQPPDDEPGVRGLRTP